MNDKIIEKLLEHDDRFERIEKKIDQNHDEVMGVLDNVMVIVSRLDQERIFTFEIIKRIQKDIERQDRELQKVKKILKIA
jgi:hypothetical protein